MITKKNLPPKKGTVDQLVTIERDVQKVLEGKKQATRRNGRYADVGEIMTLKRQSFKIHKVYQQELGDMTDHDAMLEGYASLDDYIKAILDIHPGMRWVPKMKVWVHEYKAVNNKDSE